MATRSKAGGAAAFTEATSRRRTTPRHVPAPPAPGSTERRKYTLRLEPGPAESFDSAVLALMPAVGRRIDKNEALAVLTELLASDDDVRAKVTDRLRRA